MHIIKRQEVRMNGFVFPYLPVPPQQPGQQMPPPRPDNIQQEIEKLKQEINQLKKRIANLEQKPQNDYLQKEDGMYMI